ncbi:hypothetical protein JZ751_026929 [Albula glossodonta]|uniref:Uncharacterized protein n=1 Tax=Albula glossodonta TaxID=121402 RepID=A0A8T2ND25_9TELE|nr:hypothetical protein JZ751_026929 [Albula glossodonta]
MQDASRRRRETLSVTADPVSLETHRAPQARASAVSAGLQNLDRDFNLFFVPRAQRTAKKINKSSTNVLPMSLNPPPPPPPTKPHIRKDVEFKSEMVAFGSISHRRIPFRQPFCCSALSVHHVRCEGDFRVGCMNA